ncbi:nitrogen fixation protein FixH [Caldimonas sp. KR1-144]|uniref:nitrogen fixation protein FixH n=1 Tax=Caldimonas sp. KR1-144 TaxID=3400911 RepID=UPI003C08CC59
MTTQAACAPWWRFPIVWLVIAGPLAVVVAGVLTAVLAVNGADASVPAVPVTRERSAAPAMAGRNHAATPLPSGSASR